MTQEQNPRVLDPRLAGDLTAPTALHALVFLAFGLVTVFWQEPTLGVVTLMLACYMLAYGAASFYSSRVLARVGDSASSQVLASVASVLAGGGVLALIMPRGEFWLVLVSALVLGLAGVLKMLAGARARDDNPAARDWQLEGCIVMLSAAALPLVSGIGLKAIMGTAGGGALIAGVFLAVGAFSLLSAGQKDA